MQVGSAATLSGQQYSARLVTLQIVAQCENQNNSDHARYGKHFQNHEN
jgi:hypothetical protein